MSEIELTVLKYPFRGFLLALFHKIHPSAFPILFALLCFSDDDEVAIVSVSELGKCSGLSITTVKRILRRLKEEGIIKRISRRGKKGIYEFLDIGFTDRQNFEEIKKVIKKEKTTNE